MYPLEDRAKCSAHKRIGVCDFTSSFRFPIGTNLRLSSAMNDMNAIHKIAQLLELVPSVWLITTPRLRVGERKLKLLMCKWIIIRHG